jgi:hypothetical protein
MWIVADSLQRFEDLPDQISWEPKKMLKDNRREPPSSRGLLAGVALQHLLEQLSDRDPLPAARYRPRGGLANKTLQQTVVNV